MAVKAITIGFFDGVHLGHRRVLSEVLSKGGHSAVVTFWPHPRAVLQQGARDLALLSSYAEKEDIIRSMGIEEIRCLDFTRDFARMDAATFIREVLLNDLHCTDLVLGYDNRLGGDSLSTQQVAALAEGMGLRVEIVPPCSVDGVQISSTRIRTALQEGDVALASRMLGAPYTISGIVVPGNQLGRTIGFPTANIVPSFPLKAVPGNGVYASKVKVGDRTFLGMTNIGFSPTVSQNGQRRIETNIFDFHEDIYGLEISVSFLARLRPEVRFNGLEELKMQLSEDRAAIRNSFAL